MRVCVCEREKRGGVAKHTHKRPTLACRDGGRRVENVAEHCCYRLSVRCGQWVLARQFSLHTARTRGRNISDATTRDNADYDDDDDDDDGDPDRLTQPPESNVELFAFVSRSGRRIDQSAEKAASARWNVKFASSASKIVI